MVPLEFNSLAVNDCSSLFLFRISNFISAELEIKTPIVKVKIDLPVFLK
jgi:hypothetical protein